MTQDFDAKRARIADEANDYLHKMLQAQSEGKPLDAYFDEAASKALYKVTASIGGGVTNAPRTIPSVTEIEGGRERGYDLYSLLLKKRIILVEGQVEDTMASIVCASLLYLNSDLSGEGKSKEPITMYVNSPGGSVIAGLAIYDVMRSIDAKITTIGTGYQASMGSILLVAGDERKMTRSSKYMIHQPLSGNGQSTQLTDIEIGADFTDRLKDDLVDIYVRHTGLNHKYWETVLNRDTWLSAEQAKKMGIVNEIIVGTSKATIHEEFSVKAGRQEARESYVPKTAVEIAAIINSDVPVDNGTGITKKPTAFRPELVTALSQFEEYWTPSLKALKQQQAAAASVSNDDASAAAPAAKKAAKGAAPK
jgi:ATP-dependent Clp protease protease subunit